MLHRMMLGQNVLLNVKNSLGGNLRSRSLAATLSFEA